MAGVIQKFSTKTRRKAYISDNSKTCRYYAKDTILLIRTHARYLPVTMKDYKHLFLKNEAKTYLKRKRTEISNL